MLDLADDPVTSRLVLAEVPQDVLGHDDGAVDDDAEVNGAEREQVRGNPSQVHEDEREEEGQRDGQGHDHRRADVIEKQRQQDDHQDGALDEIRQNRSHGRLHEDVARVVRAQLDVRW